MDLNSFVDNLDNDWITIFKEDSKAEWKDNVTSPKYLLDTNVRRVIWRACSYLNVNAFGVPGYACRLIEYYTGEKVRAYMSQNPYSNSWSTFKVCLSHRLPIIMSGAITLSSQLHHEQPTDPAIVANFFMGIGLADVTVENINNAINEIFEVHNFYLLMWTTARMAEILAQHVGIPANMVSFLRTVVNKADLMAWQLNTDMSQIFFAIVLGGYRILSLHLAAGAVYATAKFYKFNMSCILSQLATLVDAPDLYLEHLADFILYYYNRNQDDI